MMKRRQFVKKSGGFTLGILAGATGLESCKNKDTAKTLAKVTADNTKWFKQSLAQWSVHKELFDGVIDNLEFAQYSSELGFEGIEYVSQFFKEKAKDSSYLKEMNARAADNNVEQLLIMIDGEGDLASAKKQERDLAVENHKKWVDAAKTLGCHSIRVNLFGEMYDKAKWIDYATHGLGSLSEVAKPSNINVIVENHGWLSSHAPSLVQVMKNINMENCGTLPDFGNFCMKRPDGQKWGPECSEEYDKYKGVDELMPYAKAVSAKSHDFGADGKETTIDFAKMLQIVKKHGYNGYIGTEFEGSNMTAREGIIATKALLETLNV